MLSILAETSAAAATARAMWRVTPLTCNQWLNVWIAVTTRPKPTGSPPRPAQQRHLVANGLQFRTTQRRHRGHKAVDHVRHPRARESGWPDRRPLLRPRSEPATRWIRSEPTDACGRNPDRDSSPSRSPQVRPWNSTYRTTPSTTSCGRRTIQCDRHAQVTARSGPARPGDR